MGRRSRMRRRLFRLQRRAPPPSFVFTFPPPSPPPATALDDFFRAAITRAYAFDRYTKETTGCYSWLSSGPSLGDSADRNLLLPPGKTWGEVAFTAYGITDADFLQRREHPERFWTSSS